MATKEKKATPVDIFDRLSRDDLAHVHNLVGQIVGIVRSEALADGANSIMLGIGESDAPGSTQMLDVIHIPLA